MTLNFELPKVSDYNIPKINLPKKNELEKYAEIACGVVAAVIVAKVTLNIIDNAQEKKQDRRIKELEQRVAELEARVDESERA